MRMLRDRDLVVFSDDWGRHPFSCQHLVSRLLATNRVLWVNSVGYRTIKLNLYDMRRAGEKLRSWVTGARPAGPTPDNLTVVSPVFLPFGRNVLVRQLNTMATLRTVRRTAARLGFRDPIVLTTLPTTADIVGQLGASLVVYYCVDDITMWPGVHGDLARDLERRLLEEADLVVATSQRLQQTRSNGRAPTELLTHGLDLAHFASASALRTPRDGQRPVAGLFGLVDERYDLELLAEVARRLPDVELRIIGTWRVPQGELATLPNVRIEGPVPYEELPRRVSEMSALLLPYRLGELAESLNPLKLKECLATGIPVIATPLPEIRQLAPWVEIAEPGRFVDAVRRTLASPPAPRPDLARYLARETWEIKAAELSRMITGAVERAA